ncbi:MAG: aconitase family protein, partial [Pseudomonadota bacterium]|nr:aconitase family protein [Pseudomonadota bacterium]
SSIMNFERASVSPISTHQIRSSDDQNSSSEFEHFELTEWRNFENRHGKKTRTHLASPATVAASAIKGEITAVDQIERRA